MSDQETLRERLLAIPYQGSVPPGADSWGKMLTEQEVDAILPIVQAELADAFLRGRRFVEHATHINYDALANTKILTLSLAIKLGSIVVHADELTGQDGRELDRQVIRQALKDAEIIAWIKDMGCLLPVKRIK